MGLRGAKGVFSHVREYPLLIPQENGRGEHMDKKLLGKRINTARKERGWTSERLSEACNINATYLRQIESGAKVPSLQVFVLLCEALKVSPTYLLAEVLPSMELQNMDVLLELWQTATPKQITMMTSMIRSVLEASKD